MATRIRRIFIILSFLSSYLLQAQVEENQMERKIIQEQGIETLSIYETVYKADSLVQKRYLSNEISFNKNGKKVESKEFDINGELDGFITRYHYQDGKLVREVFEWILEETQDETVYEYDPVTKQLKKELEFEDSTLTGYQEFYYQDGVIIGSKFFDADGKEDTRIQYKFDKNGRLISFLRLNKEKEIVFQEQKSYNKKGLVTEEVTVDNFGTNKKEYTIQYAYNKKGQLLKSTKKDGSKKLLFVSEYDYDKKGLLTSVESFDHETEYKSSGSYEYE